MALVDVCQHVQQQPMNLLHRYLKRAREWVTCTQTQAHLQEEYRDETHLRAMGCHMPYGITQCYLPPDTSEHNLPITPARGWYSIYVPRTSHITSTPRAFEVILQLTRYINYLLTYFTMMTVLHAFLLSWFSSVFQYSACTVEL